MREMNINADEKIKNIDRVLIAGILSIVVILVLFLRYGSGNVTEDEASSLFSFKSGNVILIDKNIEFSSPQKIEAKDNLVINLEPGVYYWKIDNTLSGEVVQLKIVTEASLKLKKTSEGFSIINAGRKILDVKIYNRGTFTGNVVLSPGADEQVSGVVNVGGNNG